MTLTRTLPILLGLAVMIAPLGLAEGVVPNAVVNGDFELFVPGGADSPLRDSPADECIGVGHQALFGSDTVPGTLAGGPYDGVNPGEGDPAAAVEKVAEDPEGEALFLSGYGHCVSSSEKGYDAAWLNAVSLGADPAAQWSGHDDDHVGDLDGDGDREIGIAAGSNGHNLWQSIVQPFQAFTPNAEAFEFDVEAGEIRGTVIFSMSATPLEAQSPWVGLWLDCQLAFPASLLLENMDEDGHVSVDPIDGTFTSRSADCDGAEENWKNAGTDEDLRKILGRLRLAQMSFWGFQTADADPACDCAIQIDNVSLTQATTVAEEIAAGNLKAQPAPSVLGELPE